MMPESPPSSSRKWRNGIAAVCCCIPLFFVVDIHAFDDFALRSSAALGSTLATKAMLYLGADVHANGDQALRLAALDGSTDLVKTLLDHGAEINVNHGQALVTAIQARNIELVKLILDREHLTPTCDHSWQLLRGFWMQQAERTGDKTIVDLVQARLKPTSDACRPTPNRNDFDNWIHTPAHQVTDQ